jgi:hypothetical protein
MEVVLAKHSGPVEHRPAVDEQFETLTHAVTGFCQQRAIQIRQESRTPLWVNTQAS